MNWSARCSALCTADAERVACARTCLGHGMGKAGGRRRVGECKFRHVPAFVGLSHIWNHHTFVKSYPRGLECALPCAGVHAYPAQPDLHVAIHLLHGQWHLWLLLALDLLLLAAPSFCLRQVRPPPPAQKFIIID